MYVEVYEWKVFDELKRGRRVYALDTKENKVFDLVGCTTKMVCDLLETSEKDKNRIIFYFWKEAVENEQM